MVSALQSGAQTRAPGLLPPLVPQAHSLLSGPVCRAVAAHWADTPNICCCGRQPSLLTHTHFPPERSCLCLASPGDLAVHVWQMLAEHAMKLEWTHVLSEWGRPQYP